MKKDYTLFELTMVFVIILAMWIVFGIFVYVNKDKPKLEAREISQAEETLNKAILLNRLGLFNHTQVNVNLIK